MLSFSWYTARVPNKIENVTFVKHIKVQFNRSINKEAIR